MTNETIRMNDVGEEEDGLAPLRKKTSRALEQSNAPREQIVYDYDIKSFAQEKPMRVYKFTLPFFRYPFVVNPVATLIGMVPLWVLTIWCMVQPEKALDNLVEVRGNVAFYFTWFIVITKPISFFFMMWITYRYGHIKFGGKDAEPEFGNFEYFTMTFCCGIGVGIFYYGVSEPLWHLTSHWFAEAGYHSQDEIDQAALLITMFHWGFHGYVSYLVVAIASCLASYRFRLPLVFRSAFYPILGEYTWGYLGDIIDGTTIVVSISGICTSLGLGAIQISAGVQRIGWLDEDLTDQQMINAQIVIIWLLSAITTASVVSGVGIGIKYLSKLAFCIGMFLTLMIFMMEQSAYLLNLLVQTVGQYLQHALFQISFHTDAFAQLRPGEGRATDGNSAATWWFDAWTIFYWNWWVAWAVFVGLFTARVSYGRTLREVTLYTLIAPVMYCFFWFAIWGGTGLRQARQALELQELGMTYFNDTEYYQSTESSSCYDVPQETVVVGDETVFENHAKGITPVCVFETTNSASFNVLYSFSFPDEWSTGFGPVLSVLFIMALSSYFASSSDSGSLVIDILASGGKHDTHWTQRLFWSLTEAFVATALLVAGGSEGLSALQAASIICGLPYTVVLTYLLQSIYEMCEQADKAKVHFSLPRRQFLMPCYGGVFNVFEFMASFGSVHTSRVILGLDLPSNFQTVEFFVGLFIPFYPLQDVIFTMYPKPPSMKSNAFFLLLYTVFFVFWVIAFILAGTLKPSIMYWGWAAYIINACMLANLKYTLRLRRRLHGNILGDLTSSFLLYPQVIVQLRIELIEYGAEQVKKPEKKKKRRDSREGSERRPRSRSGSSRGQSTGRHSRRNNMNESVRSDNLYNTTNNGDETETNNEEASINTYSERSASGRTRRRDVGTGGMDSSFNSFRQDNQHQSRSRMTEEDTLNSTRRTRRDSKGANSPAPEQSVPADPPMKPVSRPTTPVPRISADDVRKRLRSHLEVKNMSQDLSGVGIEETPVEKASAFRTISNDEIDVDAPPPPSTERTWSTVPGHEVWEDEGVEV